MDANTFIQKKSTGFFVGMTVVVAAFAAFVIYLMLCVQNGVNPLALIFLIAALVAQIMYLAVNVHYLPLIPVVGLGATAFIVIMDNIGSYADYFSNVGLFGNAQQLPLINMLFAILLAGAIMAVVECFLKRDKMTVSVGNGQAK